MGILARVSLLAAMALGIGGQASAGAVEECLGTGGRAAVIRCLIDEDAKVAAELAAAEAAAGKRAREIEQATAHPGLHAALAKSMRDFAQYRNSQCTYVKAMAGNGAGASQAQLGCRVDLTRRRIRELTP